MSPPSNPASNKMDKSSNKDDDSEVDLEDSDLEDEEYVVEKVLKMRVVRKGKIECKTCLCSILKSLYYFV